MSKAERGKHGVAVGKKKPEIKCTLSLMNISYRLVRTQIHLIQSLDWHLDHSFCIGLKIKTLKRKNGISYGWKLSEIGIFQTMMQRKLHLQKEKKIRGEYIF
ncbi:hypothetical protein L1987_08248 [Smallanthus sonchifolius]|uniref:Uncharacterized protein n=1 Tax=Smallanthus sonchifolius TaxID=185202 RepID=A0ACB9JMD8_9ASTR|nr:hypothetical protein L1987_08248 [Smallanthus sonchifolius]